VADQVDDCSHELAAAPVAAGLVGFAVGGDLPLVDAPGRLDLDVLVGREQVLQALLLLAGKEAGAGVQGPPRGIEGVARARAPLVRQAMS
jgi:hypothetical protein